MVATASAFDFSAIIDGFFAQKPFTGPHAGRVAETIRKRAMVLLGAPDVRYMPAFKILDLLGALITLGKAVDEATQLRAGEVDALLRESLADGTALIRQFMLEAALERARYEPMMLTQTTLTTHELRNLTLSRRWAAMQAAHQECAKLPDAWMHMVDQSVATALSADEFQHFRPGPLLQLFAEMLAQARKLHQQGADLEGLRTAITPGSTLWRRYALKSERYRERRVPTPDIAQLQPHSRHIH